MPKEAYWFRHDCNARSDHKILSLRAEKGWEGYGIFWALIEMLAEATGYKLPLNKCSALAIHLGIEKQKLFELIEFCCSDECRLFIKDETHFWSKSLKNRMKRKDEIRKQNSEAGRLSGIKRRAYALNGRSTSVATDVEPGEERRGEEKKGERERESALPISGEEFLLIVTTHCKENPQFSELNPKSVAQKLSHVVKNNNFKNGNGKPVQNWESYIFNLLTKEIEFHK